MYKKFLISIIMMTILLTAIGCSSSKDSFNINEFSISYLEIKDSIYLVDNNVSISLKAPNSSKVLLNIQNYGQNKLEETLEGKRIGNDWVFEYKNNDPFTKEIWLVVYFDDEEKISEKKVITNQDQSYESAFENIIPIPSSEEKIVNLLKQKVNLTMLGWLDDDHILAKDKENLFSYDIYRNKKEMIYQNIWNIYASYTKEKVIYENDDGIHVSNTNQEENKKIFDMKDSMILKDLAWSKNENNIILNIIEDQEEQYYLINILKNTIELINIDQDLYTIENILYLDNNDLYAIGNTKPDNVENADYSNFLLSFNLKTKRVKNYTPNIQPMDDIEILSQVSDKEFLIRMSTKTISETDITSSDIIYILDTQRRTMKKIKEDLDFPYVYSLFSNKEQYIYLSDRMEDDGIKSNEKSVILGEDKKNEIEILRAIQYYPSNFYWSKDGKNIAFYIDHTKEIYLLEIIKRASQ